MQTYHTQKAPIIVREFGRNMQKMILFAAAIENREERQIAIEKIVELILEMYPPSSKNYDDYRIKIWSHILQINNYDLDVDIPKNVPLKKERVKPDPIPYPSNAIRYKHYGKGIQNLIEKASTFEDEDKKEEFAKVIGAFMKMSYKAWNRDNANDEVIAEEMRKLSRGKLTLPKNANLDYLVNNQNSGPQHHKQQKHRNSGGKSQQGGTGGKRKYSNRKRK